MILLDDTVSNLNIQLVNDDMVQVKYNFKDHFINTLNNSNMHLHSVFYNKSRKINALR